MPMRELLRDLARWGKLVILGWQQYAGAGVTALVWTLAEKVRGKPLSWRVLEYAAVSFLMFAVFNVWRNEATKHRSTIQDLDKLKKDIDGGTHRTITCEEWQSLADRFHQLSTYTEADWFRDGDGVESWTIRNCDPDRQCEFLCQLAGAMLLRSPNVSANLSDTTRTERDNGYSWLYFLKDNKVPMKHLYGTATQSGQERVFLMGTIARLSHQSYLMCIKCAAVEV